MAMKDKDYPVTIGAMNDPTQPNGIRFGMFDVDGKEMTTLIFDKNKEGMYQGQSHKIQFLLDADNDVPLKFINDKDDVLWVAMGEPNVPTMPACPQSKPTKTQSVLKVSKVDDSELIVKNSNKDKREFSFALNFVRTDNGQKVTYDPGGSNKNGGAADPLISQNAVLAIGALAIIGIAIFALN